MFQIHEKYKIRHKILQHLNGKINTHRLLTVKTELNDSNMPFNDLVKALGLPYEKVYQYHHTMHYGENQLKCFMKDKVHYIGLEEPGLVAFIDEYWIREGNKELNERIYDKTKWLVPIAALIITAGSLIFSVYTIQQTRAKIEQLKSELNNIKQEKQVPESTTKKATN